MASDELKPILAALAGGAPLGAGEAEAAFRILMDGEASAAQIGAFLMGLRLRGETVTEIEAGARALRARMTAITAPPGALDTVGTGGDAKGTYNISTAVAFVVAAQGIPLAKHGNRALSSKSGAADVLQALGIQIDIPPEMVGRAVAEVGIGFMFAPAHHSAMAHVGPARKEIGTRTIFNLLGPLANPAGVKRQLTGVFAKEWVRPIAEVLGRLGSEKAMIVHGRDGLDELTTTDVTDIAIFENGKITEQSITPEDAGLPRAALSDLVGGDADENAKALRGVFDGEPSAYRDIVLLNAAAAFMVADKVTNLKDGVALAAQTIDDGMALKKLEELAAFTRKAKQ